MDKLSTALNHFSVSAGVFYAGELCEANSFDADKMNEGHLHFVRCGGVILKTHTGQEQLVEGPAVIFFPSPASYSLVAEENGKAQVVCANVKYGAGPHNPLANALPPLIVVGVDDVAGLNSIAVLLIDEAFHNRNGKEAMMNRLLEMFVIALLRHVLDTGIMRRGMLAGLTHPRLYKAVIAIHEAPQKNWPLEELAEISAMSRSKFSKLFHEVVGSTPGDYILEWRVLMAQDYLRLGKPVGWVANAVGYQNTSALAKMFRKKTGLSPKLWQKQRAHATLMERQQV